MDPVEFADFFQRRSTDGTKQAIKLVQDGRYVDLKVRKEICFSIVVGFAVYLCVKKDPWWRPFLGLFNQEQRKMVSDMVLGEEAIDHEVIGGCFDMTQARECGYTSLLCFIENGQGVEEGPELM